MIFRFFIVLLSLFLSFSFSITTPKFHATTAESGRIQGSGAMGIEGPWQIDTSGDAKSKCDNANVFLASITGTNARNLRSPFVFFRGFGVQIPPIASDSVAEINQITVVVVHSINGTGDVSDSTVELVLGTSAMSDNLDNGKAWSRTIDSDSYEFDRSTLSSVSLDVVQNPMFGVQLRVEDVTGASENLVGSALIHCVSMTVDYTVSLRTTRATTTRTTTTTRPRAPTTTMRTVSMSGMTLPDAPGNLSSTNASVAGNNLMTDPLAPSGISGGLVAAIVLPILFVLLCVIILVAILLKRRKAKEPIEEERDTVASYLDMSAADMRTGTSSRPPPVVSAYGKVPNRPLPMEASNLPLPAEEGTMPTMDMSVANESQSGELAFYT
jgi:hypothetical protein